MASLEIHGLIEQIYDGACDEAAFDRAIGVIGERVGAQASVVFGYSAGGPALWNLTGIDTSVFAAYEAHYHRLDLYKDTLAASDQLRSGFVFTEQTLLTPEAMRRSPLVQELLVPNGLGPILGCPAHVDDQGSLVELAFYRPPHTAPFAAPEVAFLRALAPHLGRAARLRLRLSEAAPLPRWTAELLDGLAWGVALLDRLGRAAFVNREARRILHAEDGLTLRAAGLSADHHDDGRRLREAIARAGRRRGGGDLTIRRPSGGASYLATVVPLGFDQRLPAGPGVAVHIMDPLARVPDHGGRLATVFGLTPAEQRVAHDLARDRGLAEIAERHGVALSTVKTQLLGLFAKTGTNRQSQLVGSLLRVLALPGRDTAQGR